MPTADYSSYHQASGTGADGTKFSNLIDAVQATVNALDNNNIAPGAGIVASKLAVSGIAGYEFDYAEKTSNTSITATTEATANTIVTGNAVTYDGSTPVVIEFFTVEAIAGTAQVAFFLYDGAASIGFLGFHNLAGKGIPVLLRRRLTPSAAAHTYSIRATVDAGTGSIAGGAGGIAANAPAFIRITKA